jgi:hypothetical protein
MVRRPFDALFRVVLRVTSYEKSKQLASWLCCGRR